VRARLCLIILLFAFGALPASAAPILTVQSNASASVGSAFSLDITIAGVTDLFGFEFDLGFNPAFFSAVSITEGAFLSSNGDTTTFVPGAIDNAGGTITFTGSAINGFVPGVTGGGVLATVRFNALAAVIASPITLFNLTLLDSTLNAIPGATIQNGTVTAAVPPTSVPEPSTLLCLASALAAMGLRKRMRS
jgi:hypothetical protein